MTPIVDIQRSFVSQYTLRFGKQVPTRNGKSAPSALRKSIRATSHDRTIVEKFAAHFGGKVEPWEGDWEVEMPVTEIPIEIIHAEQWWEKWGNKTLIRRCTGVEKVDGNECECPADIGVRLADKTACDPSSQVTFRVAGLDVGVGRLFSKSYHSAKGLAIGELTERLIDDGEASVAATVGIRQKGNFVYPLITIRDGVSSSQPSAPLAVVGKEAAGDPPAPVASEPVEAAGAVQPPASMFARSVQRAADKKNLDGFDMDRILEDTLGAEATMADITSADDANKVLDAIAEWPDD